MVVRVSWWGYSLAPQSLQHVLCFPAILFLDPVYRKGIVAIIFTGSFTIFILIFVAFILYFYLFLNIAIFYYVIIIVLFLEITICVYLFI